MQGAEKRRKKLLSSIPIVGVTCSSARLPVLSGQSFEVVILDECSQLIEPLSLAPILAAKSLCAPLGLAALLAASFSTSAAT